VSSSATLPRPDVAAMDGMAGSGRFGTISAG
jgi:hypothetical protein